MQRIDRLKERMKNTTDKKAKSELKKRIAARTDQAAERLELLRDVIAENAERARDLNVAGMKTAAELCVRTAMQAIDDCCRIERLYFDMSAADAETLKAAQLKLLEETQQLDEGDPETDGKATAPDPQ